MERPRDQASSDHLEQVIHALGGSQGIRKLVLTVYSIGVQDGELKALDRANANAPEPEKPMNADKLHDELVEALQMFIDHEVDYMTRNNLGDPEKQHAVKNARAILAKVRS